MIAMHFLGFTFIPRSVSRKPKNLSASTPNTHFSGFNFSLYLAIVVNLSSKSDVLVFHLGGDHHVVHVRLDVSPYHGRKYSVHQPLVSRPCIF